MVSLLVGLLILALVVYVAFIIVGMLPLPEPVKQIVVIILALVFLVMLLQRLGIF